MGYCRPENAGKCAAMRIFRALFVTPGPHLLFALLFGVISLLYATVGQAGGTAFLALMGFAAFRRRRCARRRSR
jgi:hypothetical protein